MERATLQSLLDVRRPINSTVKKCLIKQNQFKYEQSQKPDLHIKVGLMSLWYYSAWSCSVNVLKLCEVGF